MTVPDGLSGMESMDAATDPERFRRAIAGLSSEVDPLDLADLLESFLDDNRVRMGSLSGLLEAGDRPALARCAHAIRGSAAIFGLQDLVRSAAALESAAGLPVPPGLPGLIDALRRHWERMEPLMRAVHAEMVSRKAAAGRPTA